LCRFIEAPLKTKVARLKAQVFIKISKRPMCNIHRNRWYITRGTQPERRVLRLECLCYNKWHPGPKLSASLRLRIEASLVCFRTLLDLPKYCLHIIHFKPCVLLGSHQSSSHIIVVSQVPSCNPFYGLLVLVHHQSLMSTLHGVGHLRVMSF
jgi:hypothetical protein